MAGLFGIGGSGGTAAAMSAAVAVVVVAGAAGMVVMMQNRQSEEPTAAAPAAVEQEVQPSAEATLSAPEAPATEAAETAQDPAPEPTQPSPPSFDLVRVDSQGNAIMAGRAQASASVAVMIDGAEAHRTQADTSGSFAAIFPVTLTDAPQVVSLRMDVPGFDPIMSAETVILAPAPPAQVAEAEPEVAAAAVEEQVAADAEPDPTSEPLAVASASSDVDPTAPSEARQAAPVSAVEPEVAEDSAAVAELEPEAQPETGPETEPETEPEPVTEIARQDEIPQEDEATEGGTDTIVAALEPEVSPVETPLDQPGSEKLPETTTPTQVEKEADEAPTQVASAKPTPAEQQETPPVVNEAEQASADPIVEPATTEVVPETAIEVGETPEPEPAQPAAPSVLLADEDGIRVLQSGGDTPPVAQAIVIDTISYDPEGEVALGGRGSGEGFVRVYLDNRPIQTTEIGVDGQWRTPLPDVDTGVYTLRVDELDAEGEVISRVETPFKREEAAVLAELNPSGAAANQDLSLITVQPGHSLWKIASERYGDGEMYIQVFYENRRYIRDPDLIYPGQVFNLPDG